METLKPNKYQKEFQEIIKEFSKENLSKRNITDLISRSAELLKNRHISSKQCRQAIDLYDKRYKEIMAPIEATKKKEKEQNEWEKSISNVFWKILLAVVAILILLSLCDQDSLREGDFDDALQQDIQQR